MPEVSVSEARPPFVLVADVGTSSVRVSVRDGLARAVAGWSAREPHQPRAPEPGASEFDADAVLERVARLVDAVLAAAGEHAPQIEGIGMAFLSPSVLGVGEDGRAFTPAYLYSDRRAEAAARGLRRRLDWVTLHRRTGCPLHAGYAPARLAWLRAEQPALFERPVRWRSLADYVYERLTGVAGSSYSSASWSGLFDLDALRWDPELLAVLGIEAQQLVAPGVESPAPLAREFAARWPALADARCFPPWSDGAASSVGSEATGPQDIALSLGTTSALRVVVSQPPVRLPSALWAYRLDRARVLVGGALNEGGGSLAWAASQLRIDDRDAAMDRAAAAEADTHGLTVLPSLTGERSPGWDSRTPAALVGMTPLTTAEQIVQALAEGVAYRLATVAEELHLVAPGSRRLIAAGGGARELPAWLQIVADVLQLPVALLDEPEATTRGVAALVLQALGVPARELASPVVEQLFEPRPDRAVRHAAGMRRQQALYAALRVWREAQGG